MFLNSKFSLEKKCKGIHSVNWKCCVYRKIEILVYISFSFSKKSIFLWFLLWRSKHMNSAIQCLFLKEVQNNNGNLHNY